MKHMHLHVAKNTHKTVTGLAFVTVGHHEEGICFLRLVFLCICLTILFVSFWYYLVLLAVGALPARSVPLSRGSYQASSSCKVSGLK